VDDERRDFLPPEPAGPEPELGPGPAPQPPPPAPAHPTTQQYPPPQQGGWQAAPPHQQQPPPPGYAPYGWQQQAPPPGWGHPPAPPQPDNGPAVSGFVLSLVSAGLLFLSGGVSSIISIGCSIAGIVLSRKGKQKVERGETQKNQGLAQAGFIIGIIGLVLAVLATLVWGVVLVALITDDGFRRDFENEFDNSDSITAVVQMAAGAARVLLG
jgi:hypothetical protein